MGVAMLVLLALLGCNLESVGAYDCDAYCDQMLGRAEDCAAEDGVSVEQYAGFAEDEILTGCDDQVEEQGMGDLECQAQTATVNNATCEQLKDLITAAM